MQSFWVGCSLQCRRIFVLGRHLGLSNCEGLGSPILPLHQPSTGQATVTIQDGGIELIYLTFCSEIMPALQARLAAAYLQIGLQIGLQGSSKWRIVSLWQKRQLVWGCIQSCIMTVYGSCLYITSSLRCITCSSYSATRSLCVISISSTFCWSPPTCWKQCNKKEINWIN